MSTKDYFSFSEKEDFEDKDKSQGAVKEESSIISFTDDIMSLMKEKEFKHVIVQIYGTKNRKVDGQRVFGVFNWSPTANNIDSFHLPLVAKKNIPNLVSGKEYYALVRDPNNNEKIGGFIININEEEKEASLADMWSADKNPDNLPQKTQKVEIVKSPSTSLNINSIEDRLRDESAKMMSIIYDRAMKVFSDALSASMGGGDNSEVKELRKEIQTLRGTMEVENQKKFDETKKEELVRKDKEIQQLNTQVEQLYQEVQQLKNSNNRQDSKKTLESIIATVKTIMELKDYAEPILSSFGISVPQMKTLGGANKVDNPNLIPTFSPKIPDKVFESKPLEKQQVFRKEDVSESLNFMGFDDTEESPKKVIIESIKKEEDVEMTPVQLKFIANEIMKVILNKFKVTTEISKVIPLAEEEVRNNFWTFVIKSGMNKNEAIGKALSTPEEFADSLMKYIPTDVINLIQENPTGKNYSEIIKELLVKVIKESAKSQISG